MKKLLYFAAALLTFAACEKEVEAPVEKATPATYKVTIKAGFADETKTAYDAAGKFSWVAGDKIGVMVQKEGELKQVTFTAKSAGAVTEFEGEVEEGWTVAEYASYPFTGVTEGYARNDFAWDKSNGEEYGWRLWGSIKPDLENPLASTPLIAKKDAEGYYSFKTATAIVKFTVENVPYETYYAYLEVPAATKEQYNLNGWYTLGEDGYPTMATAFEPWENRYNWNAPTDYNQTIDYYFFIPEGKLPAGTKFELCNSSWAAIKSFEVKQDVEILRNRVTNIAPVEIEAYSPNLEENQIWIKPWNISVNSDCSKFDGSGRYEGGGAAALVDGNAETYWHSAWYSGYTNEQEYYNPNTDFDEKYGITIDIKLEEALKDFKVSYYVRHNNNNGAPREIIFAGSNDGTSWTDIETVASDELMKVAAGARVDLPAVHATEPFSYLRLGITKAGNGDTPNILTAAGNSTAMAELLLFKAEEAVAPQPSGITIDGNFEDWDGVEAFTSVGNRFKEWKFASDETNVYFYYKIDASKIKADGSSKIYVGFDLDKDPTTGAQGEYGGAGTASGFSITESGLEAVAYFYPWDGTTAVVTGELPDSYVRCPAGTETETGKVTVQGNVNGGDAFLEISIPRAALGSPAAGTIIVNSAMQYYPTGRTEVTLTEGGAGEPTQAPVFKKVTSTEEITDGSYLFVYEAEAKAFNGGLETLDAVNNTIDVTINEDATIDATEATLAAVFTLDLTQGTAKSASGFYISNTTGSSYSNGLKQSADAAKAFLGQSFTIDADGNVLASFERDNSGATGHMILNFNSASDQKRFRYYKEGNQKQIQLYKYIGE